MWLPGSSREPNFDVGAPHALGHAADLAVPTGEQHDDAVGLTQLVGAQHDGGVAVEAHRGSLPPGRPQWCPGSGADRCARVGAAAQLAPSASDRPPKRRSRRWYSSIAAYRSARRKSGHSTSVKTSSE